MTTQSGIPDVSVVLVTYNRGGMVVDCIDKVLAQDVPVDTVYLIDNASTDDTRDRLAAAGYLDHGKVRYVRMAENVGGAGGFRAGLERAHVEGESTWFWLMDDDVAPRADCLRTLLGFTGVSECIHPTVVYQDGTIHEWEHIMVPSTTHQLGLKNRSFSGGKAWCSVNTACFEGMLVSRRIVDLTGYPLAEFFVYGDDGYYGFVASRYTNPIYVKDAVLDKKIKPAKAFSPFRTYYDTRNRFILRRLMHGHYADTSFGGIGFYGYMVMRCVNILRYSFSLENAKACGLAWVDGVAGRSGRLRY